MANPIEFEGCLDRQQILNSNIETELKCLAKLWPSLDLRNTKAEPVDTSICLVFDCSASMLMDKKLDTAIESAKTIVDTIPQSQKISLVAFQSRIHLLVDNATATAAEKDTIKKQIEQIRTLAGGSTNMTDGIKEGMRACQRSKADAKVMIILSDGAADFPITAEKAALNATDAGIQLFAVGIGDTYKADELLNLVTPSNGTLFGESEVEKIKSTFSALISRIETFVATNARLEITFDEEVQAGLAYKTSPEQAFIGNMQPDKKHKVRFNVGNIERDKAYSFLFLAIAPQRKKGELEICRARLLYDVPSLSLNEQSQEIVFTVKYVKDPKAVEEINGEVMEVFRRASITQLAERFVLTYEKNDHEQTAKYLKILIRRYDEIGDSAMKNHYEDLLADLQHKGVITNEMLNASVVASTIVDGGGELPHLVDDNF
jgi:hypothetical protein